MPIENFSTEYILGLNLKEHLETIQKIGESAAKEYQIEQGMCPSESDFGYF